jgi:hypothetical protein
MSNIENRVALAQVPTEDPDANNEFGVLRVDSDTTHRATALSDSWSGRIVRLRVLTSGQTVDVACSLRPTAEVDATVAPADNGLSNKVGLRIASDGERLRLPKWDKANETMYLVHEASAANTTLEVTLLS